MRPGRAPPHARPRPARPLAARVRTSPTRPAITAPSPHTAVRRIARKNPARGARSPSWMPPIPTTTAARPRPPSTRARVEIVEREAIQAPPGPILLCAHYRPGKEVVGRVLPVPSARSNLLLRRSICRQTLQPRRAERRAELRLVGPRRRADVPPRYTCRSSRVAKVRLASTVT